MIPASEFHSTFAINGRGSLSPQLIGGLSIHGLAFLAKYYQYREDFGAPVSANEEHSDQGYQYFL